MEKDIDNPGSFIREYVIKDALNLLITARFWFNDPANLSKEIGRASGEPEERLEKSILRIGGNIFSTTCGTLTRPGRTSRGRRKVKHQSGDQREGKQREKKIGLRGGIGVSRGASDRRIKEERNRGGDLMATGAEKKTQKTGGRD